MTKHNPLKNRFLQPKIFAFLLPTIIFWIIGGYFLLNYSKTDIHLFFNNYHSDFGDIFFEFANFFGEWQFIITTIFLFSILKNYYSTLLLVVSFAFNGIFVQFLKQIIFPTYLRPAPYFKNLGIKLNFVPNIELNFYHSFPSGHTTQVFTVFLVLALFSKNSFLAFLCFWLALFSGFSRIYLQQHFLGDVVVGSVIATFFTFIFFFLFEKYLKENEKLQRKLSF